MSNGLNPDQNPHSIYPDHGSKLFSKVISRRQKLLQAGKDFVTAAYHYANQASVNGILMGIKHQVHFFVSRDGLFNFLFCT